MKAMMVRHSTREKAWFVLLLLPAVVGGVFAFPLSYFSNTNVIIGLCLFPFALSVTGPARNNFFYSILMVVLLALAVMYQVRIFYFFAIAFYLLWLIELCVGRINVLILFLIVFMSPVFIQVVTILGFPLRLMLSTYAGALLNVVGVAVLVEGNMMWLDGSKFTVDEACMGLNMLVISMLMGVFVLAFRYHLSKTTLGLFSTSAFFTATFFLNMLTNLIRIIVLVLFRIPPEHPMHEIIGIVCLLVYVVIPLHFFGAWLVKKCGVPNNTTRKKPLMHRRHYTITIVLSIAIVFAGVSINQKKESFGAAHANIHFKGAVPERLQDGVSKIATDNLLIYVKTIPEFFTGEHTPLMCWKGSGYDFSRVTTATVAGTTVYKGMLVQEGKSLHTAWWYSNGEVKTISQLDWRVRMLKGEPDFCLVNITAEDEHTLIDAIKSIFTMNVLTINADV